VILSLRLPAPSAAGDPPALAFLPLPPLPPLLPPHELGGRASKRQKVGVKPHAYWFMQGWLWCIDRARTTADSAAFSHPCNSSSLGR
jgi:hypothetical protein